jgi:hypothetical protein
MRIPALIAAAILFGVTSTGFAANTAQGSATATAPKSKAQTQQVMNRENVREMSQLMEQMKAMLQEMSQLVEQKQTLDKTRTREMAQLMEHAAENLRIMARQMNQKKLTANEQDKLKARIKETARLMEQLKQAMSSEK